MSATASERPNRFRPQYRELTIHERDLITDIKEYAEALARLFEHAAAARERSLALINLEQAVMWAVKGVTG